MGGPLNILMWGHYNSVGCSARLKTSFELNLVTEGKQGTFPFLISIMNEVIILHDITTHIAILYKDCSIDK